jgi:hypothetical protein
MKKVSAVLIALFFTMTSLAQEKNKKMTMEVDGVCQMCKVRIEKAALGVKGVKYALWDIDSHQLSLIMDERKTNAMEVKKALVAEGHDTIELKATEAAYNKVMPCCKYRDEEVVKSHH